MCELHDVLIIPLIDPWLVAVQSNVLNISAGSSAASNCARQRGELLLNKGAADGIPVLLVTARGRLRGGVGAGSPRLLSLCAPAFVHRSVSGGHWTAGYR